MGIYLYAIAKTGKFNAEVDGETKKIFPMMFKGNIVGESKKIDDAYNVAQRAKEDPEFTGLVAMLDRNGSNKEGAEVYRLNPYIGAWVDIQEFPGKLIGRLYKMGRKWVVESNQTDDDEASECENEIDESVLDEMELQDSYGERGIVYGGTVYGEEI